MIGGPRPPMRRVDPGMEFMTNSERCAGVFVFNYVAFANSFWHDRT